MLDMNLLSYRLGRRRLPLAGGPYRNRPVGTYGVKMAMEIDEPCDVDIPTRDFDVPDRDDLIRGVEQGLDAMWDTRMVYVGCMGGIGRTGLYMAAMAKLLGYDDPVQYVRDEYYSHAVETKQQMEYIDSLQFPLRLRMKVKWRALTSYMRPLPTLTPNIG